MQQKMRDGALYAQAEATRSMTAVQMKKIALIEDQNMLLLMTMPIEDSAREDAREYMRLRRGEEFKKLIRRLSEKESKQHAQEAREFAAPEVGVLQEYAPLHERGGRPVGHGRRGAGRSSPSPAAPAATAATRGGGALR
jgi:hypothetical protein